MTSSPVEGRSGRTVALSLVSHTNVGKTTLARTLLGRDIGEVRDEAHVTETAERYTLVESPDGDRLELWDTPGFGDSRRLAKRFASSGNPLGWFMSEVWDRFRDRPFYSAQRAIRNILDEADVVLYLVNAAEQPDDIDYLDAELQVLTVLGKPVIVLLNQLGKPRGALAEQALLDRWRERLEPAHCVSDVLPLDAFARCWVQEGRLLTAVSRAIVDDGQRRGMNRLRSAWRERQHALWRQAMAVLAARLTRAALDAEPLASADWSTRLGQVGAALGLKRSDRQTPREIAEAALAERLEGDLRESTEALIRLHGLDGAAATEVQKRLAAHFQQREGASEGRAAVWGGLLTGALAGLKADVLAGGLTLGGGMLAGGIVGALGGAGVARGFNLMRGVESPMVVWSDTVLDEMVVSALLTYLAVAHYGRGRGDWTIAEHPPEWGEAVRAAIAPDLGALHEVWSRRKPQPFRPSAAALARSTTATDPDTADADGPATVPHEDDLPIEEPPTPVRRSSTQRKLDKLLVGISERLLKSLYPGSSSTD